MNKLPNFIILGAQKAGSSWLRDNLSEHPEVFIEPKREIHFFDKDYNYQKGMEWYASQFEKVKLGTHKAIGEKTPEYFFTNANGREGEGQMTDVHTRLHKHLPDIKIIVVLRKPEKRVFSQIKHLFRTRRVPITSSLENLIFKKNKGILERGQYDIHLENYLSLYPKEKTLVLVFEEVMKDKQKALKDVCQFLEVDTSYTFKSIDERINYFYMTKVGLFFKYYIPPFYYRIFKKIEHLFPEYKLQVSSKIQSRLKKFYQPHNERLFKILGREITDWK